MFLFLFLLLQQFITSFLEVNPISDAYLEVKLIEWTQKHVPWWKDIESAIPPPPPVIYSKLTDPKLGKLRILW